MIGLNEVKTKSQEPLACILAALLLMLPAFVNGSPLFYSDSSTYIISGFEFATPFDRPITYGIFLWLTSLGGLSFWLPIFSQSLLLAFLIFKIINVLNANAHPILMFGIVAFVAVFTPISWSCSQLIADVFTPISFLAISIVFLDSNLSAKKKAGFYCLFFLGTAMHMGHLSYNIVFFFVLLIMRSFKRNRFNELIALQPILIGLTLTVLSIGISGAALSKSKHGFFMGALVEHGILKEYLDEYCPSVDYKICAYKDELPDKGWKFLWNEDSPFYKLGGWKETKPEFSAIISKTLTTPKYILIHIRESLKATVDQLISFRVGDGNGIFLEGSLLFERLQKYFPNDIVQYRQSLQMTGRLKTLILYKSRLDLITLLITTIALILLLFIWKLDNRFLMFTFLVLIAILVNAWSCGTFANAIDRLGAKMIWILPLLMMMGWSSFAGSTD